MRQQAIDDKTLCHEIGSLLLCIRRAADLASDTVCTALDIPTDTLAAYWQH